MGEVDKTTRPRKTWLAICGAARTFFTGKSLRDARRPVPVTPGDLADVRLRPAYIPASIFAAVIASFLRETNDLPDMPKAAPVGTADDENAAETAAEKATKAEEAAERRRDRGSPLEKSLQTLVDGAAGSADQLRASLEHWYDAQMERVSGWYKRESKRILVFLAIVVVLVMNVDTASIARTLWTDPTARRALADAAQRQIEGAATTTPASAGQATAPPPLACPRPNAPDDVKGTPSTTTTSVARSGDAVTKALDCARSLPIPIGWRIPRDCTMEAVDGGCRRLDNWPSHALNSFRDAGLGGWLLKIVGWGVTVGALTFGAPFWFDLLNRFGSLRGTGTKPKASTEPST